ncbi:uncharacterized protein CTHT_0007910 [Thermochaetoides thermophila DSM 1495]|uniref:Uncharacterized protein n=1 Tax=Chaetomium thermophilum (strain DSM 1495 / CBS 144.50 / IMI 039719) TaxID=759272 RepID=G0RZW9_CHATD|nr:hypothetical protein CTHT_0007910 [Thermochaetoides thermophila DSM 1495]EGS23130.1 hypothetical protein CTHT_0007910 [Thermochaetoides thermophila DSM 1495]
MRKSGLCWPGSGLGVPSSTVKLQPGVGRARRGAQLAFREDDNTTWAVMRTQVQAGGGSSINVLPLNQVPPAPSHEAAWLPRAPR